MSIRNVMLLNLFTSYVAYLKILKVSEENLYITIQPDIRPDRISGSIAGQISIRCNPSLMCELPRLHSHIRALCAICRPGTLTEEPYVRVVALALAHKSLMCNCTP